QEAGEQRVVFSVPLQHFRGLPAKSELLLPGINGQPLPSGEPGTKSAASVPSFLPRFRVAYRTGPLDFAALVSQAEAVGVGTGGQEAERRKEAQDPSTAKGKFRFKFKDR